MTNRSIMLLKNIQGESYEGKKGIAKEILTIEFKKIIAQAKKFSQSYDEDTLVNTILNIKDSEELFIYLDSLSVVEISLLSSYGIDISFMNLLKVSE